MSLAAGQTLSFYEILGPLGAGGMGEVYRARDTRLEREVALKVLPDELADDEERLRRFEREAKTLASLNHPNVAGIHGMDQVGDVCFIAMELVPGEDLSDRVARGPLPVAEAVEVCRQIAAGLEAAHAAGVVHRDLKPANVRLTPDGRVKLLDFGLAKPIQDEDATLVGTESILATQAGMALGTPPYMSPEQARGQEVSRATDVWAFGCVLFECLTGKRAFAGDSHVDVLAAIVTRDPDWQALPEETPGRVREVLRRAFVKDPAERTLSIADAGTEILEAFASRPVPGVNQEPVRPSTPFVGRDAEREQILELIDAAAQGRGGLVLLGGEPGVGKTRLAEQLLADGRERGMLVLKGHAYEEDGAPFITSVEILEDMMRLLPQQDLREMLGSNASELARLLPELRRRFPDIPEPEDLPAEQQRRYLFNSVLEFIGRASRVVPMIMLLDDLHWADESSLLLLEHLAPHLEEVPVFMVATYRDVELEVGKPFAKTLARLVRQNLGRRISIRRFAEADVAHLIAALGEQEPPPELTAAIFRETEGNPFFVTEVFEHLVEEGLLFDAEGKWRADLDVAALHVPEGVRLVIGRRLERLDEGTPKVLTLAATIGLRFDLAVVERAVGDADAVLDALEEAEAARLVAPVEGRREPRYEFVHALVRHTLLSALSVPRRQRLHLRVGEAMEHVYRTRLEERSGDIAHHLYQSGAAADGEKTRRFLGLAARRALDASAADKALILVDRALEEDEDLERGERAGLLYLRGVAHRTLGDWKAAAADWEPALPVLEAEGKAEIVAEICDSMTLQRMWDNEVEGARELIERGLRAVGDEPSAWRCRFLSSLGHAHSNDGDHDSAERFTTEAIALAEELGDEKLLAGAFVGRLYQGEHWVRVRMQAEVGERAIEVARRSGSAWDLATVMGAALMGNVASGRCERAEELVAELLPLALRTGHLGGEVHAILYPAIFHVQRGELEAARSSFESCIERWREVELPWTSVVLAMAGLVELWLGERERCLALMEEAVNHEVTRTYSGYERAHLFLARAYLDHPEAAALMHEQSHRLPVAGIENPVGRWITGIATVEAAVLLGEPDVAAALHPCMTQLLEAGTLFPWMLGLTERFAGIAAAAGEQWDVAERHFETALRQAAEMPHRVEAPHVQRWYAHMLLQRDAAGDPARARALLDSARASYDELGMGMYAEFVESMR